MMLIESKLSMVDEIKEQRDYAVGQLDKERLRREALTQQIQDNEKEASELRKKDEQCFESIQIEMQKLVNEKDEALEQSSQKDIKIKSLMKTNLELQSQLASLNQLVSIKDDLS